MDQKSQATYFQYHMDSDYPVFVKVEASVTQQNLFQLLEQMKFRELKGNEEDSVEKTLSENPQARLLTLKMASFKLGQQINQVAMSDQYGAESVVKKEGYKVYRYKGMALLVYSSIAGAWECGVTSRFAGDDNGIFAARSILNRFLSWALVPLGVVGFWGVPVDEGFVVLNQKESQGEVVFVDVMKEQMLSMDGMKSIYDGLEILRLDGSLRNKKVPMSTSQLMSFLSVKTSFLDPQGANTPLRQLVQRLAQMAIGSTYPRESFQHRTDMGLSKEA